MTNDSMLQNVAEQWHQVLQATKLWVEFLSDFKATLECCTDKAKVWIQEFQREELI